MEGLSEEHAALLAQIMAERGQIVHYADDEVLRDVAVLNPEVLSKAISYVLEDRPTGESGGILLHARLAEIWRDRPGSSRYPRSLRPILLRLMEKFDISFRLSGLPHRSLVAQLVPHDRPRLPWFTGGPLLAGARTRRVVVRFAEPAPPGACPPPAAL